MKVFSSATSSKPEAIVFELAEKTYTFQPGKKASALMALLVNDTKSQSKELDRIAQLLDWFSNGLNREHNKNHDNFVSGCQACDVQKRLADEDDDLEFDTVIEATTWLIGESTNGNPTG